jgi:hypothetical protein
MVLKKNVAERHHCWILKPTTFLSSAEVSTVESHSSKVIIYGPFHVVVSCEFLDI